ncbi:LysM peptidoglycan-binding domain-containing protein, partial [Treponema pallidum]
MKTRNFSLVSALYVLLGVPLFVSAASYDDNEFSRKSRAYSELAEKTYDAGEYDVSAEYARLAEDFAQKSSVYIKETMARTTAEDAMNAARTRHAWAKNERIDRAYPTEYLLASEAIKTGGLAFDSKQYDVALTWARKALDALKNVKPESQLLAKAAKEEAARKAAEARKLEEQRIAAQKAQEERKRAEEEAARKAAEARKLEEQRIAAQKAQEERKRAEEEAARKAAEEAARKAEELEKGRVLPAQYKVTTWSIDRECFWNIAKNPAVYGNPFLWKKLYEANKDKIP